METTPWEQIEELKLKLLVGLVKVDHWEYVAWCDEVTCKGDMKGCMEFLSQVTASYFPYEADD